MKKILIITYYWPPKGGVGVQRWLKLAKYLDRAGYDVTVYTAKDGITSVKDDKLTESVPNGITVLERKIFEPQKLLKVFSKKTVSADYLMTKNNGPIKRLLYWIRANVFVPDSRAFWIKPSIRFLNKQLTENPVDLVISTGPPHSMHLIAMGLVKKHPVKWVADFRDPWTNIVFFDNLPLMKFIVKKHKRLEKKVLTTADHLLTVSPSWGEDFKSMGANEVSVITNGFDPEDYVYPETKPQPSEFKIGYFGLFNKDRDHSFFWEVLQEMRSELPELEDDLKLFFSGEMHPEFFSTMKTLDLENKLEYHTFMNHKDAICEMTQCDLLLVSQAEEKAINGRIPAKVFEYIGAKRPVLAIGEKGSDLEKILDDISFGWFVGFGDKTAMKEAILAIYQLRTSSEGFDDAISKYSRELQAKQVVELFDSLK
ncbi:MAG: hypothetical protein DCO96_12910 [Fluviicola sp. XM-24bin1]|nr:MAG: hypothetical protein DCO96_12910 [Fluviicola sp. XM-24bin1]